ncbi:MAG: hypothetical protein Q9218_001231 [Villophora microphyllina]
MDETSPKHQFLPLSPLPSIAELPKQELPSEANADQRMPAANENPQQQEADSLPTSREQAGSNPSASADDEAASVPLPLSRQSGDSTSSTEDTSTMDPGSSARGEQRTAPSPTTADLDTSDPTKVSKDGESDSWASRLASILPRVGTSQSARQDTPIAGAQASRSASVAPGAYPESESTGRSPRQTPDSDRKELSPAIGQPELNPHSSDSKSVRSRKSVSIVTPDAESESGNIRGVPEGNSGSRRDSNGQEKSASFLEDKGYKTEATEREDEHGIEGKGLTPKKEQGKDQTNTLSQD